jgi:hypothetical protein
MPIDRKMPLLLFITLVAAVIAPRSIICWNGSTDRRATARAGIGLVPFALLWFAIPGCPGDPPASAAGTGSSQLAGFQAPLTGRLSVLPDTSPL